MTSTYLQHHEEARTSLVARMVNEGIAVSFTAAERHGGGQWSSQLLPHSTKVGEARLFTVYLHTDGTNARASLISHRVTEVGDHDHQIRMRHICADWTVRANQASIGLDHPLVVAPKSYDPRTADVLRECGWYDVDYSDGLWSASSPDGNWYIEVDAFGDVVQGKVHDNEARQVIKGIDHIPLVSECHDLYELGYSFDVIDPELG